MPTQNTILKQKLINIENSLYLQINQMKRKSDYAIHQLPKNFPFLDAQYDYARREPKRNFTNFRDSSMNLYFQNAQTYHKNSHRLSNIVVNSLLNQILDELGKNKHQIQTKKVISSAIKLTNSIALELLYEQSPYKSLNSFTLEPDTEPIKNTADRISGFIKQNFAKKPTLNHKLSCEDSLISFKDASQVANLSVNHKKLPILIKELSEQKTQVFVPLQNVADRKKQVFDFDDMLRERLLKQIQNRKFKEKIDSMSSTLMSHQTEQNIKGRSTHNSQKNVLKEDVNFDYDGNKISILTQGKVKSNFKILKTVYKITKQKVEEKPLKLHKKVHQRISYVPRGSRNFLEINSKTIGDFGGLNHTSVLKQKLQAELRKTNVKFIEKDFHSKDT